MRRIDRFYWGSGIAADVPALTYYLVISLVPLTLGLTALGAIVLGNYADAQHLAGKTGQFLPEEVRKPFVSLVLGTKRNSPLLLGFGVVAMVWTCAGAINVIERCLCRLLDVRRADFMPRMLRQFRLALVVAFVLALTAVAASSLAGLRDHLHVLAALSSWWVPALGALVFLVMCAWLFRTVVRGRLRWRSALAGAIPPTVVAVVLPSLIGLYARSSELAAVQVFLLLLVIVFACYLLAQALLIGSGVAALFELRRDTRMPVNLPQIAQPGRGQQFPPTTNENVVPVYQDDGLGATAGGAGAAGEVSAQRRRSRRKGASTTR